MLNRIIATNQRAKIHPSNQVQFPASSSVTTGQTRAVISAFRAKATGENFVDCEVIRGVSPSESAEAVQSKRRAAFCRLFVNGHQRDFMQLASLRVCLTGRRWREPAIVVSPGQSAEMLFICFRLSTARSLRDQILSVSAPGTSRNQ